MKLDTGTKLAVAAGTIIVIAVVGAVTAFVVHMVSTHNKADEIRKYGATLHSTQWEQVFLDCDQLHEGYLGKTREFVALPHEELPDSIKAFGFQDKLAGRNAAVFTYSGGYTSNSIDLHYAETPEKNWVLKFDKRQVHPRLEQ